MASPGSRKAVTRAVAGLLFCMLLLGTGILAVAGAGFGRGGSGSLSPTPIGPAPSASVNAPRTPLPSTAGSSAGVTASSTAGGNAFAVSGTGPATHDFTAATTRWDLRVTYACGAGTAPFALVVTDGAGRALASMGAGGSAETRQLPGPGTFHLVVGGACTWGISATG
jgi:hypothetical protein